MVVLVVRIYVKLTKGKCHSKARLDGCTALVTGANNGNYLVDSNEKITPRGPCLAFFLFFSASLCKNKSTYWVTIVSARWQ